MAGEKIGEVERARLLLGQRGESFLAGVERVAMRAFDAPYALFLEHAIELAARAAIAVEAEDLVVGRAVGADLRPHRVRDAPGMVVQLRRQASDVDMVEPEREHLARQGAAGDDEDFSRAVLAAGRLALAKLSAAGTMVTRLRSLWFTFPASAALGERGYSALKPSRAPARSPAGARAGSWRFRPRPPRRGNRRRRRSPRRRFR